MTDSDEDVLELMQQNVALNSLSGRVDCRQLDWSDSATYLVAQGQQGERGLFDVVLAADVLYHGDGSALCDAYAAHMPVGGGTVGYLGYRPRGNDPETRLAFFAGMWARGFVTHRLEDDAGLCAGCDDPGAAAGAGGDVEGERAVEGAALDAVRAAFDGSGFAPIGPVSAGAAEGEEVETALGRILHPDFTDSNRKGQVQIFRFTRDQSANL